MEPDDLLCGRKTRTMKLCSPGTRARLGALGVGRVRMSRAVEDQSAPIPEEITSELGRIILKYEAQCRGRVGGWFCLEFSYLSRLSSFIRWTC